MLFKKYLSFILLGICASCYAQNPFTCVVKLDRHFSGKVMLTTVKKRITGIDTIEVNGKEFTVSLPISQADEYRVLSRPYRFDFSLLAQPGCQYKVDVKDQNCIINTSNGSEQKLYESLKEVCEPLIKEAAQISTQYMTLKEAGRMEEADKVIKANDVLFEKENKVKFSFIKQHPNSLAAMKAANEFLSLDYKEMNTVRELLKDNPYKYTYFWRSFESKYQELADKWIEDKPAPDFTTTDINGKSVRLSDFRGKTVLLDFWASWCVPCRAKMKELRKVYEELKKRDINVLSISLDEKKAAWLKASKEDDILWTNTCELTPFRENAIGKAYKVTSVPQLYVISPEGRIVMQNPTIDQILNISKAKSATSELRINGNLTDVADTLVLLGNDFGNSRGVKIADLMTDKGKFEYTVQLDKPKFLYFYCPFSQQKDINAMALGSIPAIPGESVSLTGTIADFKVEGTGFYRDYAKLNDIITHTKEDQLRAKLLAYVKEHPAEEAAAFVMSYLEPTDYELVTETLDQSVVNGRMKGLFDAIREYRDAQKLREEAQKNIQPGNIAPDFTLKDINGNDLTLSSLRGRYVILDFWGSWCGWCIKGMPKMKEYYAKYKGKIEIVGIDCNDTEAKWKAAVEKHQLPWLHVISRADDHINEKYAIKGYPTKIIINPDGSINKVVVGEDPEFYTYLDSLCK